MNTVTNNPAKDRFWWVRPILLVALLVAVVGVFVNQNRMLALGEAAPELHLTSYDGRTWTLDQLQGRPVVVNFWATWCPPCMAELPAFAKAAKAHKDDVVFVGVAVSSPDGEVFETIRRMGITYPIARTDGHSLETWRAQSLPTTYMLDAQGKLAYSARGQMTHKELNAALDDLLAPTAR